jgi:hypothetical protein
MQMMLDGDLSLQRMDTEQLLQALKRIAKEGKGGGSNDGVAEDVLAAAKKVAKDAVAMQAKSMNMAPVDEKMYTRLLKVVAKEVGQLRVVLEGLEAREKERVWLKNMNQVCAYCKPASPTPLPPTPSPSHFPSLSPLPPFLCPFSPHS